MRKSNICGIHGFRILVGITIMIMLLVGGVEAVDLIKPPLNGYNISDCTYIYLSGEYILTQDIITNSFSCINICSGDVIFDGAGYTIYGIGQEYSRGVSLPGANCSMGVQQVTVKNLTVTGWGKGISVVGSSNITLNNNNVSNNEYGIYLGGSYFYPGDSNYNTLSSNNISDNNYGIYLSDSNYNTLSNNNVSNNNYGIYLYESISNIIYNNYFYNLFNAYDSAFGYNYWNTTKQAGTNIIGGPYLGGNYWSDYAGNDTDGDGLGNTSIPYNSSGNITNGGDYLPLTEEKVTQDVNAGETVTTDPEGTGPTVSDPVETSVTTSKDGTVSIEETSTTETPPSGFYFIGQQVTITAPDASVENPLIIVFRINASKVPPEENEWSIKIYKDGVEVPDNISTKIASPDPCVSNRTCLPNGDIEITVLTSTASTWNFGMMAPLVLTQVQIFPHGAEKVKIEGEFKSSEGINPAVDGFNLTLSLDLEESSQFYPDPSNDFMPVKLQETIGGWTISQSEKDRTGIQDLEIQRTSYPNRFTFRLVDTKTGLADQDYQNIVVDISSGNDAGRLSVQLIENNGMYTL